MICWTIVKFFRVTAYTYDLILEKRRGGGGGVVGGYRLICGPLTLDHGPNPVDLGCLYIEQWSGADAQ